MPFRRLHIKIMFGDEHPPSDSDSSDNSETLTDLMKEFKQQMEDIDTSTKSISSQIKQLYTRAKKETTDWLHEPFVAKASLHEWLKEHNLSSSITIDEFLEACYSAAKTIDMESRTLTFSSADAAVLWNGERRLTVFDIIARIPSLFE